MARINKKIEMALPRQANSVVSKMQETQRYFIKGLIITPIVELAISCCKNGPLDLDSTRILL